MRGFENRTRTTGLAVCSAMAVVMLSGCAGQSPFASSASAPVARGLNDAGSGAAVARAEKRVARSPESASARTELAQAYLSAGRFDSAATTFEDAVTLGGDNARIGLGMALAYIGAGRNAEAISVLGRWRNDIPASDFGLALALAGQPEMGVAVLTDAVRSEDDNNVKTRQNLAYAYALQGQWMQARLIAGQDVPADQLDARLSDWASKARPDASRARVAGLLGAPLRADPGQPTALALGNKEDAARLARTDIPTPAFGQAPAGELPPVKTGESFWGGSDQADPAPAPAARPVERASLAAVNEVVEQHVETGPSNRFVAKPVIQKVAKSESNFQATFERMSTEKIAQPEKAKSSRTEIQTHLVQLGSFQSREGAERAWGIFVKRNPSLKDHTMRITEAVVNGARYYRVAAEGFDRASAHSLCSSVRNRGDGCLAYSESQSLPGALPKGGAVGAPLRARR
ncbi:lipopolysaccharide assembly protein LapB [Novosphingobium sp. KN65.2]|uniref:tetratricopeptide repeat protein n=1 Tax=Novosphingobium sp. KN65.2 TaxID=1478134 RepID=UPI0005E67E7E|nr:tetratricopeptide repeat protein [Novosphingobium sp. KN65.2]CDO38277.1 conserved exported hypothetical protein [Novosphingobium sp. KN65.2]